MPMLTKIASAGDMVDMNCDADRAVGELFVGRGVALVPGAHKGLDQAGAGNVFLQDAFSRSSARCTRWKSGSILVIKTTMMAEVTRSSAQAPGARGWC